mmetsp:Transcript_32488/g.37037  ORF Transcript_32488/g.37037 Transcript_32488/m.37037 type:complete len:226 (-) Transcript_32488:50-727(-)
MKSEISDEMSANNDFWEQRPLSREMIEYASQDVVYLPSMYAIFKKQMRKASLTEIFDKSSNCHFYSLINKNHPGISFCKAGQYLAAYVKNFHRFAVFCSLNIGSSGIVVAEKSRNFIENNFGIGDILNLEVVSINEDKNSVELKVPNYYLEMDADELRQYCKLAKITQNDKHRKAVDAIVESGTMKPRKISMSVSSKAFFPKPKNIVTKVKSGSFDDTKASYSPM